MKRQMNLAQASALVVALQEIAQARELEFERLAHGLRLMRDGQAYYSHNTESWMCESATHPDFFYAVDLANDLCSCPDRTHRGAYCKHLIACWLVWRVGEILNKAETFRAAPEKLEWVFPIRNDQPLAA